MEQDTVKGSRDADDDAFEIAGPEAMNRVDEGEDEEVGRLKQEIAWEYCSLFESRQKMADGLLSRDRFSSSVVASS